MFALQEGRGREAALEDLQFQICLSYIRHASQKLAMRESQHILQSSMFLNSLTHDKTNTETSTTDNSFDCRQQEVMSPRGSERRAFMRRSKGWERPTHRSLEEALQEVKEVCTEGSIAVIEALISEHRKITEQLTRSDFMQAFTRSKCQHCLARSSDSSLDQVITILEEKLKKTSNDLTSTTATNQQLEKQLTEKTRELEKTQAELASLEPIKSIGSFVSEKQESTVSRLNEIKLIERSILIQLQTICLKDGCERCQCIRAVKTQLTDFRTYLQRQAQSLQRLYHRHKKTFFSR